MTSDLAKLMETINLLQSEPAPEPVIEIEETRVHPLLQAMQELKEEGIIEAKESIKDQIEKAYIQDGGNIDDYFVRHSRIDKLGYSANQLFKKSPDVDHPSFRIDYVGSEVGSPALWFYPLRYYLQNKGLFAENYPYAWLVKLKPNAWLQTVDKNTKTKEPAPQGKERVGILRRAAKPSAIFFKPGFDVVDKFYDYGSQHKRHGEVKGAPVEENISESVDPSTIFNQVKEIHREFRDIEEGDLPDRIYWFDEYKKTELPLSQINLDEYYVDEDLIEDYIEYIKDSPNTMPPIVYDPIAGSVIDGMHRANAYARLGYDTIPAYVGTTKSSSYGEREEIDEARNPKFVYHVTPTQNLRSIMKNGLVPSLGGRSSKIAGEQSGIYLFPSVEAAEDAVMNWLGDEFDEDEPLTLLKVNIDGLEKYISQGADYELIVNTSIEPNRIKKLNTQLEEASPDTLEGSFTPDLVESKTWLAKMLAKGLKGKNAGTIYVLGSWYGNMGIFLQQAGVKFKKLVLVEPDEEALMRSKELLDTLNDEGKLILIHQNAEDVIYEKPGVVINTSCNETGPVFLTKLPDNMLCLLQARNNVDNVLIETDNLEEFKELFPLNKTYFAGEKHLTDPETDYTRYMIIGRSGKKINSELNEDSGGNYLYHATSAGGLKSILQSGQVNAASGPQIVTRAQTKMPTVSMTRDWGYASGKTATQQMAGIGRDAILVFDRSRIENNFKTLGTSQSSDVRGLAYNPNFGGKEQNQSLQARAIAKKKYDYAQQSDPETKAAYTSPKAGGEFEEAVVVPKGALPIKGTLVGFYVNPASQLTKDASIMDNPLRLEKTGPNKFIAANQQVAETSSTGQGGGSAGVGGAQMVGGPTTYEQEYGMFKSKGPRRITAMTNEALDSSYPYEGKAISGRYTFETEDGVFYKVYFQGKDLVEIAFSAILPGEEENFRPDKTTITGTGNSRKVFGTVIKIVQEYVDAHEPKALYFISSDEPSRLRLYQTMTDQVGKALPDYYAVKPTELGDGKAFMLKRKDTKINEDSITLNKLYGDNKPDRDDAIWDYGTMIWDNEYPIETINSNKLNLYLQSQYRIEHVEELFDMMDEEQQEIVEKYVNDPNLSDKIIVLDDGHIVDGNHRALAAVIANKPIKYIDIGETDEPS